MKEKATKSHVFAITALAIMSGLNIIYFADARPGTGLLNFIGLIVAILAFLLSLGALSAMLFRTRPQKR